jgi:hypothetical protein
VARRQLLTEYERRLLFDVPHDVDALTHHYSFTRAARELLAVRRGDANRWALPCSSRCCGIPA